MQDETTTADSSSSANIENSKKLQEITHVVYEVGKELLSKPNALSDILESEGYPPTVVFCNSPSDADLVDVLLRKRGVGSQKLIGYVPRPKLTKAIDDFRSGAITTLVVTDIGARGVDFSAVQLVVNYSVPAEGEAYAQRMGIGATPSHDDEEGEPTPAGSSVKKSVSLVSALDLSNLHYLKKAVPCEFTTGELPSPEALYGMKYNNLKKTALSVEAANDPKFKDIVQRILSDSDKESIVGYLVHNTLDVLPSLKAASTRVETEQDLFDQDEDFDDDGEQPRYNTSASGYGRERGGRNGRGGRDNRDRGGRGGNRDQDGGGRYGRDRGNRGGDFRGRGRDDSMDSDEGYSRGRQDSRDDNRRGGRNRPSTPPEKFARLYIGHGDKAGFSKDQFIGMLAQRGESVNDVIKHFSVRTAYSFVDVPEDTAQTIIEKLDGASLESGVPFYVKKAVTLTAQREEAQGKSNNDAVSNGGKFEGLPADLDEELPEEGVQ